MWWQARGILQAIYIALALAFSDVGVQATPLLLVDMATPGKCCRRAMLASPWHPASLTKLTTAIVTFQAIDNGVLSLDTPVTISAFLPVQTYRVAKLPAEET